MPFEAKIDPNRTAPGKYVLSVRVASHNTDACDRDMWHKFRDVSVEDLKVLRTMIDVTIMCSEGSQ